MVFYCNKGGLVVDRSRISLFKVEDIYVGIVVGEYLEKFFFDGNIFKKIRLCNLIM